MIIIFKFKCQVYVRPCTKYPTYGIKACVAKQGETIVFNSVQREKSYVLDNFGLLVNFTLSLCLQVLFYLHFHFISLLTITTVSNNTNSSSSTRLVLKLGLSLYFVLDRRLVLSQSDQIGRKAANQLIALDHQLVLGLAVGNGLLLHGQPVQQVPLLNLEPFGDSGLPCQPNRYPINLLLHVHPLEHIVAEPIALLRARQVIVRLGQTLQLVVLGVEAHQRAALSVYGVHNHVVLRLLVQIDAQIGGASKLLFDHQRLFQEFEAARQKLVLHLQIVAPLFHVLFERLRYDGELGVLLYVLPARVAVRYDAA
ncbi:hypothetical protein BpHYR1_010945 [Brachionus plicatilis]|uniref:Uncharacterized protein n=1 Tax=Brachionus plicatilis TaxID=10195 RepID=A0A3M7T7Q7_BRAPC|nr:hypothetical protein BpHYR1_010945 [Brachionus plicatilis]